MITTVRSSTNVISATTHARIRDGIDAAARRADAELRSRGTQLMLPLSSSEIELVLRHMGVTTKAERALATFMLFKTLEPSRLQQVPVGSIVLTAGEIPPQQQIWKEGECAHYTGENGKKVICCHKAGEPFTCYVWG